MNDQPQSDATHQQAATDVEQPTSLPGTEPAGKPPAATGIPLQSALSSDVPGREQPGRRGAPRSTRAADATADGGSSKSQRVRDYLREHPEARNRDVAEALAAFGVTAADVANVKSQQKRKQDKPKGAKRRRRPSAEPDTAQTPAKPVPPTSIGSADDDFSLTDLERTVTFIRAIGSFQRARKAIDLLQEIRQIAP